jgi:hypothetical protein
MGKKMCPKPVFAGSFSRQSAFEPRKQGENVPRKPPGKRFLPGKLSRQRSQIAQLHAKQESVR